MFAYLFLQPNSQIGIIFVKKWQDVEETVKLQIKFVYQAFNYKAKIKEKVNKNGQYRT